jgi:hypothetical protein
MRPEERKAEIGNGVLFTVMHVVSFDGENKIKVKTNRFAVSSNGEYLPAKEDERGLFYAFILLHPVLINLSATRRRLTDGNVDAQQDSAEDEDTLCRETIRTPLGLLKYILRDRRLLPLCSIFLATGDLKIVEKLLEDPEQIKSDRTSLVRSSPPTSQAIS